MRFQDTIGLLVCALLAGGAAQAQVEPNETKASRTVELARAKHYMAAAANPLAADAGREMLAKGGSAADAAIAMQLVLSLVEPQSSGVSGGGFAVVYDAATGQTTSIDGRETAPAGATERLFLNPDGTPASIRDAIQGGRAVGTPGMFRLLEALHKKYGVLPWRTLFAPAIRHAEQGFAITPRFTMMVTQAKSLLAAFPAARAYFLDANGESWPVGHILKNPDYARLLHRIAAKGADAYYTGATARKIADAVQTSPRFPGSLTVDDLKAYKTIERPLLCGAYRQYKVCSMAPPSSGATTLLATLALLEPYDLKALGPQSPKAIHLVARAQAVAFADRDAYVADPAFIDVPTAGLIDRGYLATRAGQIDPERATPLPAAGTPPGVGKSAWLPDHGHQLPSTSHFVAIDAKGNAVTYTGTVQAPFGSFLLVDGAILNNEMTDFAFVPAANGKPVANRVEPGKRPRSSMTPTLVFNPDGSLRLALGSAGGSRIIGHVLKTLIASLDWGMDIQRAIDYPNYFLGPQGLEIEDGSALETMKPALAALGYTVVERQSVSGLQGLEIVRRDGDTDIEGGADPRREGVAVGD